MEPRPASRLGHLGVEFADRLADVGQHTRGLPGDGVDGGLRRRHAAGRCLEAGAGALGADDRALEHPVGALRERLAVEGGRGGRAVVHA